MAKLVEPVEQLISQDAEKGEMEKRNHNYTHAIRRLADFKLTTKYL